MDNLEIPMKIVFSSIGKIEIKIPWKTLGSNPVEIFINDINVIINPLHKSKWKNKSFDSYKHKQK